MSTQILRKLQYLGLLCHHNREQAIEQFLKYINCHHKVNVWKECGMLVLVEMTPEWLCHLLSSNASSTTYMPEQQAWAADKKLTQIFFHHKDSFTPPSCCRTSNALSCCHKLSTFTKINLGGRWRELSFPDSEAQIPPCLGRRENSILLIIISVEIDVTSSLSSSSSSSELRSWLKNVGNSVSCFLNMPPSKCQLSWVCHWTSPQCRIIRDRLLRPLTLANATPGFCLALRCSAREKHV